MNIDSFRCLFAGQEQLRAPVAHEQASITTAILHMPTPRMAQIADEHLKAVLTAAIAIGGGILIIGMAPSDLEISGTQFTARCDVRLSTSPERISVMIEGQIDERGRVDPSAACLAG